MYARKFAQGRCNTAIPRCSLQRAGASKVDHSSFNGQERRVQNRRFRLHRSPIFWIGTGGIFFLLGGWISSMHTLSWWNGPLGTESRADLFHGGGAASISWNQTLRSSAKGVRHPASSGYMPAPRAASADWWARPEFEWVNQGPRSVTMTRPGPAYAAPGTKPGSTFAVTLPAFRQFRIVLPYWLLVTSYLAVFGLILIGRAKGTRRTLNPG